MRPTHRLLLPSLLLALAGCHESPPAAAGRLGEELTRPSFSCDGYPRTDVNNGEPSFTHCELRAFADLPATGAARMRLDNGAIVAGGGDRGTLTLRAYVYATGRTPEDAAALAAQVEIHTAGNDFHATGPATAAPESWRVSFDADLPRRTDLTTLTGNGAQYLEQIAGRIRLESGNGAVTLVALAGSVQAYSGNGGIDIDLAGDSWSGGGLAAETGNGSVAFRAADGYSAHFSFYTVNGSVSSEMGACEPPPGAGPKSCEFDTGSGGATLRGTTGNGRVSLARKLPL